MFGSGTIVNTIAIIIGGILGLFFGKLLKPALQDSITKVTGLCTIFIALSSGLPKLISDASIIVMIVSLVLGTLIGEILDLEKGIERFGIWLKQKSGSQKDSGFVDGFMTASFTVCIGAMAVLGSLEDGLNGQASILYAKSLLDFIIIFVLAGSMGKGAVFSFVPVFLFQGSITLLAGFLSPMISEVGLEYLSLCGSVMIFAVGCNLIKPGSFKVANQLPSLLFALALSWLPWF